MGGGFNPSIQLRRPTLLRLIRPLGDISGPLICVRSRRPNRWMMATLQDLASPVVIQTGTFPSCLTIRDGMAPAERQPW